MKKDVVLPTLPSGNSYFYFLIHGRIGHKSQQKTDLWINEAPIADREKTSVKGNRNYTGASEKISDH